MTTATDELAELCAAFDPESIFRSIALTLAVQVDTSRDHQKVMSIASTFYDFIDPFALSDESTFKLTLTQSKE